MSHLIHNSIQTPDGTILISRTRHDYKIYLDDNGLEYMVDGGLDYARRSLHKTALHTELSVYSDDSHKKIREVMEWGTRGKDGKQPLVFKLLKNLSTEHIRAIIATQKQLPSWRVDIFKEELKWRKENGCH